MTQMNRFFFNGQQYYIKQTISLFDLLNYFNYKESLLVIEYNNKICNQKNWKKIFVKTNDKIEVVTIVGGG